MEEKQIELVEPIKRNPMETMIEPSRGDARELKANLVKPNPNHMTSNAGKFKEAILNPYPHSSYDLQISLP